jgi:hypothetical protein
MKIQRTRGRKQRMFDGVLIVVSFTAFAYAYWPRSMGGPEGTLWGLVGIACAVGSGAGLIRFVRAWRSPDDGRPYLEPEPSKHPATRGLRASVFAGLVILGVTAFGTGLAGVGFEGATWWRAILFSFSWPVFLTGAFGLLLTIREGRTIARSRSDRL